MELKEFINRCDALETKLSDMGFIKPEVTSWVRFCGDNVAVKAEAHYTDNPSQERKLLSPLFKGDDPDTAIGQLTNWIDSQPTPAQVREQEFTKTLAYLVEEGRAIGTPILADLEATMMRLSENILTA